MPVALLLLIGLVLALDGLMTGKVHSANDNPAPPPERIGGYEVLDIKTQENTACYDRKEPHVILRALSESHKDLLSSVNTNAIKRDLRNYGFPEETTISIVGPFHTREQAQYKRARWNQKRNIVGCVQFGGTQEEDQSEDGPTESDDADQRLPISPGYATVVDNDIGPYTNHNVQSVVLIAPTVGDNQSFFSAFLNNALTVHIYLLQNGLIFENGYGDVVWTD